MLKPSKEVIEQYETLCDDLLQELKRVEQLRDQAREDFNAMPNGELNGMIEKDAKKKEWDGLAMLYVQIWRLWMDCRKALKCIKPDPIVVVDRSVGFGFADLYTDGAGNCFSDADSGL